MNPQALRFATEGLVLPQAAPGPDYSWVWWIVLVLGVTAFIVKGNPK